MKNFYKLMAFVIALMMTTAVQAQTAKYVKLEEAPADWTGEYLIVYEYDDVNSIAYVFDGSREELDKKGNFISLSNAHQTINGAEVRTIDASAEAEMVAFTVTASATPGMYNIKSKSGYWIGFNSTEVDPTTGVIEPDMETSNETPIDNSIAMQDGKTNIIVTAVNGFELRFNSDEGKERFRYHASGKKKAIKFYKKMIIEDDVTELPEGWQPCAVSNLMGTWSRVDDKNNITLTFDAPTQMQKYDMDTWSYEYNTLKSITKIEIKRSAFDQYNYRTIKTIDNPQPGETITFTDEDLAYGKWDYSVIVYTGEVSSDEWDWSCKTTVVAGQIPADFYDIDATVNGNDVKLSFMVPTEDTSGNPLEMAVNAQVKEMKFVGMMPEIVEIKTVQNLTLGENAEITINNVKDGLHTYVVTLSTIAGSNDGCSVDVFVGKDKPGNVENIIAEAIENGVVLTWEAPTMGMERGDFGNPEDLTYNIYRKSSSYEDGTLIASGIKALTYTDNYAPAQETKVFYDVIAINEVGEGERTTSNAIILGPASSLPYAEGFDKGDGYEFDNSTISKAYSSYYCTWNVAPSIYVNDDLGEVTPRTGDGLGYAMYSSWMAMSQWDAFTTGNINFSNAENPVCTIYLYDVANGGSDMKFKIQTSTDGTNFTDAMTMNLGEATASGWVKVEAPLNALKGVAKGQVRICSEVNGQNLYPVVVDDMLICDGEATAITSATIRSNAGNAIYNLQGQRLSTIKNGIVIIDGKKAVVK